MVLINKKMVPRAPLMNKMRQAKTIDHPKISICKYNFRASNIPRHINLSFIFLLLTVFLKSS